MKPPAGPRVCSAISRKDLYLRFDSSISPIARIMKYKKKPIRAYTNMLEGPATLIVRLDPMNMPVPIAPPKAISCR